MKDVLFIIDTLVGGGAEKALIELLKHFDYTRYRVTLCVVLCEGVYFSEIPEEVEVVFLYTSKNSYYRKSNRYYLKYNISWLMKFQINRKIKKHYDTIISFLEGRSLFFHSLIKNRGHKNITWVHCDLFHFHWTLPAFYDWRHELNCYKSIDDIVFVSHNAMGSFEDLYKVDTPKRCIYNVIDVDEIRRLAGEALVPHERFTITSIGTLFDEKGFDRFIRVARRFKDAGYSLLFQLIGQGEKEAELIELRDRLDLQDDFFFLGFKKPPYTYLKTSNIFVNTSLSEGYPLVICEALTLGVPVVATKTAGAIELLNGGEYGLLTEHDDQSIYNAIKLLVDNENLREKYQEQSLNRAKSFRIEGIMQQVYDLF